MADIQDLQPPNSAWIPANGGDINYALLQLKSDGPVLVQIAARDPGPTNVEGIVLMRGELEELPLPGIEPGDILYLRSLQDEDNNVAVYTTNSA